jgi:hypothetical protein
MPCRAGFFAEVSISRQMKARLRRKAAKESLRVKSGDL